MKIKSIKKIDYTSKRYDIGVADNNNLFADSILVHNCQNLINKLEDWLVKPVYVTEKLEGSSITCFMRKNESNENPSSVWDFGVCSRNLELKLVNVNDDGFQVPVENKFVSTTKKLDIEEKMRSWCEKYNKDLVLQGELIGEGVQDNIYKLHGNDIRFFTAQDGAHGKLDIFEIAKEIGVETVPIIESNVLLSNKLEDLLVYAEYWSVINPNQQREGIVIRAMDNSFSFKVISNKYLLKQKE